MIVTFTFINYSRLELDGLFEFRKILESLHSKPNRIDLTIFHQENIIRGIFIPFSDSVNYLGIGMGKIFINDFSKNGIWSKENDAGQTIGEKIIQLIELCSNPNGNNVFVLGNAFVIEEVFSCISHHYYKNLPHDKWNTIRNDIINLELNHPTLFNLEVQPQH